MTARGGAIRRGIPGAHPIDPFLTEWRAAGGEDGADLRSRVYEGLALPGRWDRERLRLTLRSLLTWRVEDRERFERVFNAFFAEEQLPPWMAARFAGEDADAIGWNPGRALAEIVASQRQGDAASPTVPGQVARRQEWTPLRWIGISALAVAAALAMVMWPQRTEVTRWFELLITAAPVAPLAPAINKEAPLAGTDGAGAPVAQEQQGPSATQRLTYGRGVAAVLLAAGMAAWIWHWRRRRYRCDPCLSEDEEGDGPASLVAAPEIIEYDELDLRGLEPAQPFSSQELDQLAYHTGLVADHEQLLLDLHDTVNRTCQRGGLMEPIFRPGRRVGQLCIVRTRPLDVVGEVLVSSLATGLRRRGVSVSERVGVPGQERFDLVLVLVKSSGAMDAA